MKYREKLAYIAVGGTLMLVGMVAGGLLSPLGAQNEVRDAEFGTITCRRIEVIKSDGDYRDVGVSMDVDINGGTVRVYDERGSQSVIILPSPNGDGVIALREGDARRILGRVKHE